MSHNEALLTNRVTRAIGRGSAALALAFWLGQSAWIAAQTPAAPSIVSLSKPQAGDTQIIFHGTGGPFQIQKRTAIDATAPWLDMNDAKVTEIQTGVFMATFPLGREDAAFYRVVSNGEVIAELKGWSILVQTSAPANGIFFAKGENPVVTVTILDNFAQGITRDSLSTLGLYMHGPEDPRRTVTPVKLLGATADRTKTPHHYINLKTNPNVLVAGNTLTYALQPVTDEDPGTYTLSVRAVLGTDALQQIMKFASVQIATNVVETPVVAKASCAACHQGPISGKMYMHHIDPRGTSLGSWSYDAEPVRSCKPCHNNDGYAAYTDASATATGGKVPDHIVRRVHGVHMGEHLSSDFNTNKVTGNFRDYTEGLFPADVRNCKVCHQEDNRWKTEPSRLACGSCHDNTWFGAKASIVAGMEMHAGGAQTTDNNCGNCHTPEDVADYHRVDPPAFQQVVKLEMSAPANGKYYAAGDKPQITVKITDAVTGQAINPTNMVDPLVSTNVAATEWKRANLFVSGPRADTVPVLTTAATNTTTSYANNELRMMRDANKRDSRVVARTADAIVYQLDDVAGLVAGTYTVFVDVMPAAFPGGWAYINFQVGTTNVEAQIAGSCIDCHADTRIHATSRAVPMIPDICKSCHDNLHQLTGKTNWLNSQYGFGVSPISRRAHGIHYGNYVTKPNEVISSSAFAHVIFPQDVRNCTKCHSQSSTWNSKPSRLACLACHDDDVTKFHASLATVDPTPQDPWNGDEVETCAICHGSDSEFSAKKVHAISNPYVPPYPRAPRE